MAVLTVSILKRQGAWLARHGRSEAERAAGRFAYDRAAALLARPAVFREWSAIYNAVVIARTGVK